MVKCFYFKNFKIYCVSRENKIFFFLNKIDMNYNDVYCFGKGLYRICMLFKLFEVLMKCV